MSKKEEEIRSLLSLLEIANTSIKYSANDQLNFINRLQSAVKTFGKSIHANNKRSDNLSVFNQWLVNNQVDISDLSVDDFDAFGHGLKTNRALQQNQLILSIPKRLFFFVDNEPKNSTIRHFIECNCLFKTVKNLALAVYLMYHKNKSDSFWKPYIDALPNSYNTCLYFTYEDFHELKPSPALSEAVNIYKSICRQFARVKMQLLSCDYNLDHKFIENFDFDNFRWAVSTVMTRQNFLPGLGTVLIPFWDFCNHQNGYISTDYDPKSECCKCYAMTDFEANQQVFIYYGDRSNYEFFLHNGFVYENNVHDSYTLKLGIGNSDVLREAKLEVLKRFEICETDFNFIVKTNPSENQKLHIFLRVFHMTADELKSILIDKSNMKTTELETLDTKSRLYLKNRLMLIRNSYKVDENVAETGNRKLIRHYKQIEKRLLDKLLNLYNNQTEN